MRKIRLFLALITFLGIVNLVAVAPAPADCCKEPVQPPKTGK